MRRICKLIILAITISFIATSCSKESIPDLENGNDSENTQPDDNNSDTGSTGNLLEFDVSWDDISNTHYEATPEVIVTDKSNDEYDDFVENSTFTTTVHIHFNEEGVSINDEVSGITITTDGGYVDVNSTLSGIEYKVSGSSSDGGIKFNSGKKFKLTLSDLSLRSNRGSAINIQSSKRVFIEIADGTVNNLVDSKEYTLVDGEDQKGCIFSEAQLLFSGNGELNVTGNYRHAICSDDYIHFRSGTNLNVISAVSDGIHTNDKIIVSGGKININASSDGMECEKGNIDIRSGEITISAGDDAIIASYEDGDASITPRIEISNGLLLLTTTDPKGMGIKSTGDIMISGGIIKCNVSGDASKAIKADGNMIIKESRIVLLTSGNGLYESNDISSSAGINCDGDLIVSNSQLYIKSTGSAGKGISIDGALTLEESEIRVITTGKQYIYNRLDSSAKGIKAEGNISINSGTIWVRTTGGEGSEGIESKNILSINGGSIAVYSYDDCLNASSSIVINSGDIYCHSSGNDAIDSNGTFTITGGIVVAVGASHPEGGIDCDNSTFKITGGTIIGIGGSSSTPTASVCTQRSIVYNSTNITSSLITIQSTSGEHVMSYSIPQSYTKMVMLFSSDKLTANNGYKIYSQGSTSGGNSFYGLSLNANYTIGSEITSFTTSNMITTIGSNSSGGGGRP
ncbi:MAG: carbohydrate-binding domain-containing protein [Bacteroidales bacterium]